MTDYVGSGGRIWRFARRKRSSPCFWGRGRAAITIVDSKRLGSTSDNCHYIRFAVIRRFRHRGLRRLYEDDDRREVNPQHADKIARILARLDVATRPEQIDLTGLWLHTLKGELAGYWGISILANWRHSLRFTAL